MVEPRPVIYDADQLFVPVVIGDVPHPARRGQTITRFAKESLLIYAGSDLTLLNMKDFILTYVNMLKRDVSSGVHCPLHGENFRCGRDTSESFLCDWVGKGFIKVNCHF